MDGARTERELPKTPAPRQALVLVSSRAAAPGPARTSAKRALRVRRSRAAHGIRRLCLPELLALALSSVLAAACAPRDEPTGPPGAEVERTAPVLTGQLRLPPGAGSRGVELMVTTVSPEAGSHVAWILFDDDGRFRHASSDPVTAVRVSAGIEAVVFRLDGGELPAADDAGRIDLGTIDLTGELMRHRLALRSADGAREQVVRVAMWSGRPPDGVALGSRQFPPIAVGSEMEWLVPLDAEDVHFLVEQAADAGRGLDWRTGPQQLFGPFDADRLPAELVLE